MIDRSPFRNHKQQYDFVHAGNSRLFDFKHCLWFSDDGGSILAGQGGFNSKKYSTCLLLILLYLNSSQMNMSFTQRANGPMIFSISSKNKFKEKIFTYIIALITYLSANSAFVTNLTKFKLWLLANALNFEQSQNMEIGLLLNSGTIWNYFCWLNVPMRERERGDGNNN